VWFLALVQLRVSFVAATPMFPSSFIARNKMPTDDWSRRRPNQELVVVILCLVYAFALALAQGRRILLLSLPGKADLTRKSLTMHQDIAQVAWQARS
jgi:hypothetical protein